MLKHVNFTGRRRIPRGNIDIVIHEGSPRTFDASFDLDGMRFPPESRIYLEAMCAGSSVIQRYSFGTIELSTAPPRRVLDELDGERVFFTLKVVDESEDLGKILGLAEGIQPEQVDSTNESGRRGILPIVPKSLGQEIWRVAYDEPEVCLLVNDQVPGIKDRLRWDPLLQATIYPAAFRMILTEAVERGASDDDGEELWMTRWLKFAKSLHPEAATLPEGEEDQEAWIDDVVESFAARHELKDQFLRRFQQLDGEDAS
jgi:hypothetical protein